MANFTALAAARRAMTPGNVRRTARGRRAPVPRRLRLRPGPSLRRQGGGPPRDRDEHLLRIETDGGSGYGCGPLERAIVEDRKAGGSPRSSSERRHRKHRRDRSARGACGPLAAGSLSGFTRTAPYGASRSSRPRSRRSSPASSAPIRSPLTRTVALRPLRAGATLVRERAPRRDVPQVPGVPRVGSREPVPGPRGFSERGVGSHGGFKALKVWMGFMTHGAEPSAGDRERRRACSSPFGEVVPPAGSRADCGAGALIANFRYRPELVALRQRPRSAQPPDRQPAVGDGSFFLAPTILKGRTLSACASSTSAAARTTSSFLLEGGSVRKGAREGGGEMRFRLTADLVFDADGLEAAYRRLAAHSSGLDPPRRRQSAPWHQGSWRLRPPATKRTPP